LKIRQNELKNLEEACDEVDLMDEDVQSEIPFLMGEVFISHDQSKTQTLLNESKQKKKDEIKRIEQMSKDIQAKMSDLKGHLYSRFGNNIYLENDE
jgi:prefoldin subunit 4